MYLYSIYLRPKFCFMKQVSMQINLQKKESILLACTCKWHCPAPCWIKRQCVRWVGWCHPRTGAPAQLQQVVEGQPAAAQSAGDLWGVKKYISHIAYKFDITRSMEPPSQYYSKSCLHKFFKEHKKLENLPTDSLFILIAESSSTGVKFPLSIRDLKIREASECRLCHGC